MGVEAKSAETAVRIRPLRLEDTAAVTKILLGAPEAAPWTRESVGSAAAQREGVSLVSENDSENEVTGVLLGRQLCEEAEILNLAVKPARRKRGEGGALLDAALSELKKRGAIRVFLEVRESNRNAIAFYTRHGFRKTGRRETYYREPEEAAILMEKSLA